MVCWLVYKGVLGISWITSYTINTNMTRLRDHLHQFKPARTLPGLSRAFKARIQFTLQFYVLSYMSYKWFYLCQSHFMRHNWELQWGVPLSSNTFGIILSHSLSRCSGFVCFSYRYIRQSCLVWFSRAASFIQPILMYPPQKWDYWNNLHVVPLQLGVWVILDLVSFLVFWRTLAPVNVQVCLLDWYYLGPWLWWPEGSAETALQHGKPVSLLVFVGWARSRLLGQIVCLCPELSVKDRLSRTCCFGAILSVYDWSPWCSSWEDTMCVFHYEKRE